MNISASHYGYFALQRNAHSESRAGGSSPADFDPSAMPNGNRVTSSRSQSANRTAVFNRTAGISLGEPQRLLSPMGPQQCNHSPTANTAPPPSISNRTTARPPPQTPPTPPPHPISNRTTARPPPQTPPHPTPPPPSPTGPQPDLHHIPPPPISNRITARPPPQPPPPHPPPPSPTGPQQRHNPPASAATAGRSSGGHPLLPPPTPPPAI
ncbi:uncharacterized protein LOC134774391 [Penaeus indicus]|uniref:uncharacterized protein LOC134774391 n=1 Tax=Penaeus indicus TaxID=29960 RepID=UPI00300D0555